MSQVANAPPIHTHKERSDEVSSGISDSFPSTISRSSLTSSTSHSELSNDLGDHRDDHGEDAAEDAKVPLNIYIPIGCLHFPSIDNPSQRIDNNSWHEIGLEKGTAAVDGQLAKNKVLHLISASWIRAFRTLSSADPEGEVWRIFILPEDVARVQIDRDSKSLCKMLRDILPQIDVSSESWNGNRTHGTPTAEFFDPWATPEDSSLFFLFNTLPSPNPQPSSVKNRYYRAAIRRLLDGANPWGLRTPLYPYQRRSAATMLQREVEPRAQLDPRLECRTSPTGQEYYFGPRDCVFMRQPKLYDHVRGGVLAETMGLGKTLICITAILTTKAQCPLIPPHFPTEPPRRRTVGSLMEMSAAKLSRSPIPWRTGFELIAEKSGEEMSSCIARLESQIPSYEVPPRVVREFRKSSLSGPPENVLLGSGTIIVVPPNLVGQWQSELSKHVEEGTLTVLVLNSPKDFLPPPEELLQYDILLFNRRRFEAEVKAGDLHDFPFQVYQSPLKRIHWLRIIIDEGQEFSSGNSNAALMAEKFVRAERRWIVSGTPARDLLGVEVDLPAMELSRANEAFQKYRRHSLDQRRSFDAKQEQASGAAKSLGALASRFLKAQPWSAPEADTLERAAVWDEYIFRHEHPKLRTYSSFSQCLRSTLEGIVIKTQPFDVERDLNLPPLKHSTVRLKPSIFDKMTTNLFILLYTANAVTSERSDQDYLFHKASRGHLQRLTQNLRQSSFFWVGFNTASVTASLNTAEKYLSKTDTKCTVEDRKLMCETMDAARLALASPIWGALSDTQEMGMFVRRWPDSAPRSWALESCVDPLVVGLTQLVQAQRIVNSQLRSSDPTEGLASLGQHQRTAASTINDSGSQSPSNTKKAAETMVKNGVPSSSLEDATKSKKISVLGASQGTPGKRKVALKSPRESKQAENGDGDQNDQHLKRKKDCDKAANIIIPRESSIGATEIAGTTSSKFSYLLDRVLGLYQEEKILIFYDGNHIAYYLSQAFDLLNIKHLIYANTLSSTARSKYIVLFNNDSSNRVLLMDIKQAAHGLNLSSASRVFFVSPPCRPDVEAQAIKRAHRIGQTRPVVVETLILQGTVEEAIQDRAQNMTKNEHLAAKTLEEDEGIRGIIQDAKVIPLFESELKGENQMAPLNSPQQVFGRPGRGSSSTTGLEKEIFGDDMEQPSAKRQKGRGSKSTRRTESGCAAGVKQQTFVGTVREADESNAGSERNQMVPEASIFGG